MSTGRPRAIGASLSRTELIDRTGSRPDERQGRARREEDEETCLFLLRYLFLRYPARASQETRQGSAVVKTQPLEKEEVK